MNDILRLLRYARPYLGAGIVAMVCMAGVATFTGAFALLIKNVLDDVFINRNRAVLQFIPWVILVIFLLKGIFFYGQQYLMGYLGQGVVRESHRQSILELCNDLFTG